MLDIKLIREKCGSGEGSHKKRSDAFRQCSG